MCMRGRMGLGGWRVYTDIGNNESWHRATLPSREKTICVCFVYVCELYIMYVRDGGKEVKEESEGNKTKKTANHRTEYRGSIQRERV